MKKRTILIITLILISILMPIITAEHHSEKSNESSFSPGVFINCYVVASGPIDFTWQLMDIPIPIIGRFIAYWPVIFIEPQTEIAIYSKKGGDLLWQDNTDSGELTMHLFCYKGVYNTDESTDDTLFANLDGKSSLILIDRQKHDSEEETISKPIAVGNSEIFVNSYIEVSGYVHNDWPAIVKLPNMIQLLWLHDNDYLIMFGLYSYILLEEDAIIKVYESKDGNLLWQHDGMIDPLISLFGFSVGYDYNDTPQTLPNVSMNGNFIACRIKLNNHP